MYSSQNTKENIILTLTKNNRNVFRFKDIALLTGHLEFQPLNNKLNYYVRTGKLLNPRRGIYALPGYNPEELACNIYAPSYLSLQYVLQRSGVIFQFDPGFTIVSYLTRSIEISDTIYQFRKIKGEILTNLNGINRNPNHVNIASPERAYLDLMYLNTTYHFDNLSSLNKRVVLSLLPIYNSKTMTERVGKIFGND